MSSPDTSGTSCADARAQRAARASSASHAGLGRRTRLATGTSLVRRGEVLSQPASAHEIPCQRRATGLIAPRPPPSADNLRMLQNANALDVALYAFRQLVTVGCAPGNTGQSDGRQNRGKASKHIAPPPASQAWRRESSEGIAPLTIPRRRRQWRPAPRRARARTGRQQRAPASRRRRRVRTCSAVARWSSSSAATPPPVLRPQALVDGAESRRVGTAKKSSTSSS